jgi:hypothetical protein
MKRLMAALLTVAILSPAAVAAEDAPDAEAEAKYQAMLTAAKADPAATDWQALRFAYADRPSFSLFAVSAGLKAIHEARAAHDWPGLVAAADKVFEINYADGEAHRAASVAYYMLGKSDDAEREKAIAVAIFKSMMRNGDGKSREHAFCGDQRHRGIRADNGDSPAPSGVTSVDARRGSCLRHDRGGRAGRRQSYPLLPD